MGIKALNLFIISLVLLNSCNEEELELLERKPNADENVEKLSVTPPDQRDPTISDNEEDPNLPPPIIGVPPQQDPPQQDPPQQDPPQQDPPQQDPPQQDPPQQDPPQQDPPQQDPPQQDPPQQDPPQQDPPQQDPPQQDPPEEEPPIVCNPLDGSNDDALSNMNGLKGELIVGTQVNPPYDPYDIYDRIEKFNVGENAIVVGQLFMNNINVPYRRFDEGFPAQDGGLLRGPAPHFEVLKEWFKIHLKSRLLLPADYQEGRYEFATVSDDGIIIKFNGRKYIDESYLHSPQVDCPKSFPILFKHGRPVDFEVEYSQGPRTEITFQMLWRKVDSSNKRCSYFKDQNGSDVSKRVNKLLNIGFQIVPSRVFHMPEHEKPNPCSDDPTLPPAPGPTDPSTSDNGKKIKVCHVPPGQPEQRKTLVVGNMNAAQAMIDQNAGSYLGPCQEVDLSTGQ